MHDRMYRLDSRRSDISRHWTIIADIDKSRLLNGSRKTALIFITGTSASIPCPFFETFKIWAWEVSTSNGRSIDRSQKAIFHCQRGLHCHIWAYARRPYQSFSRCIDDIIRRKHDSEPEDMLFLTNRIDHSVTLFALGA